jgi:hypothetical protein
VTTAELEAEIVRLHQVEHWPVGTIAAQLSVHADAVKRVLGLGGAAAGDPPRARMIDPYRDFVALTLAQYPTLRATRLHDMLRERGFKGAVRTLREYVAQVRPRPRREVFLRTEPMPGEQSQIDWAYVGKVRVDGGERALWLFVLVLAYSRDVGRVCLRSVGALPVSLAGARGARAWRAHEAVAVRQPQDRGAGAPGRRRALPGESGPYPR